MAKKITPSLEDYLETIYFLYLENAVVRVTDIAVEMNISKPSVNKAINTLKSQGYVNHEPYSPLSLTEKGRSVAINIAKRHKVLKRFLIEVIEVEEAIADKEACLIEHSLSSDTIEKMESFLEKFLDKE